MKDKCGGGIKEKNYVYESVGEIGEKNGVVNCVWCVKNNKKNTEKRHMKKKWWKKRKVRRKKNSKARNV